MTLREYGYIYVYLEWHVIWVKVKYVVSCLGWLVSLTWSMYECECEMSLLSILKPLVFYVRMTWDLNWCLEGPFYGTLNVMVMLWISTWMYFMWCISTKWTNECDNLKKSLLIE